MCSLFVKKHVCIDILALKKDLSDLLTIFIIFIVNDCIMFEIMYVSFLMCYAIFTQLVIFKLMITSFLPATKRFYGQYLNTLSHFIVHTV